MNELKVIVIPETGDFALDVSHRNLAWTNKKLGEPQLDKHNARYLAPLWLENNDGINRIFQILKPPEEHQDSYEFVLGNSFVLPEPYNDVKQRRVFSYKPLYELGFIEIKSGLLIEIPECVA